jgi:hypothetical protein
MCCSLHQTQASVWMFSRRERGDSRKRTVKKTWAKGTLLCIKTNTARLLTKGLVPAKDPRVLRFFFGCSWFSSGFQWCSNDVQGRRFLRDVLTTDSSLTVETRIKPIQTYEVRTKNVQLSNLNKNCILALRP